MELNGRVHTVLAEQSGQGKNGTWRKREFILETEGQYPKKVCIAVWGDKIDQIPQEGDSVNVSFDVESREYNEKWYTDVKAWKITANVSGEATSTQTPPPPTVENLPGEAAGVSFDSDTVSDDDLPF